MEIGRPTLLVLTLVCTVSAIPFNGSAQAQTDCFISVFCPPHPDPQSFIDGLSVQVNGVVWQGEPPRPGCDQASDDPPVWDWGDGSYPEPSYFPASHQYAAEDLYQVTVTVLDPVGQPVLLDDSCRVDLGPGADRTYVSTRGSDSNECSLAAPCRTFAAAILATEAGGEVLAIDSGDYGAFTADKGLTVSAAPGVYAGISVPTGSGVHVNTTQEEDIVVLRGLTIYSSGGESGVLVSSGQAVIKDCHISGFTGNTCDPICFAVRTQKEALIEDSILLDNDRGLWADGETALAWLNRTRVESSHHVGVFASGDARAVVRDSVISNSFEGIVGNWTAEITVQNSLVAHNQTGVRSGDSTVIRISGSTVVNNGTGLSQADSSIFLSRGDNTVEGNDTDTSGTIGAYSPQ